MSLFGSSVRESIVFEAVVNRLFNRQSIINLYIDTGHTGKALMPGLILTGLVSMELYPPEPQEY
jgi:hypothetical protein